MSGMVSFSPVSWFNAHIKPLYTDHKVEVLVIAAAGFLVGWFL